LRGISTCDVEHSMSCQVHLRSFAFLMSIKSGPATAFRSGLQGSAVQNRCARFGLAIQRQVDNCPQIMRHGLKASRLEPALSLLINRAPRRQIVGRHAPRATGPYQPAQTVEEFPQRISSLRGMLVHQCQIRHTKIPFFVADIARITFSFCCHPQLNAGLYIQITDFSFKKLISSTIILKSVPLCFLSLFFLINSYSLRALLNTIG